MYQIRCDDIVIHDSGLPELSVINAKCKLALNKTGSLTFSIAPTHPHYDKIHKLSSEITLYQDDKILFCGRVLNDEIDFDNIKYIECEGDLSYLLDTFEEDYIVKYDNTNSDNVVRDYLGHVIVYNHTIKCVGKPFILGNVTVTTPNNKIEVVEKFRNNLDVINESLLEKYGGYIFIRHENDSRYIDYLTYKDLNVCNQILEFGKNIIDMNRCIKGEDIFTGIIPLGGVIDYDTNSTGEKHERRCKINYPVETEVGGENENFIAYSSGVYDSDAVDKYGYIWKIMKWDDVNDADTLLSLALKELRNVKTPKLDIELSAIDLHLLDVNIDSISVGDKIHCISAPHNMDDWLIVKGMSIDIDSPENTTIELISPTEKMVADDSITSNNKDNEKSVDDIKNQLKEDYPTYKDLESYTPSEDLSNYATKPYVSQQIDDAKTWTGNNYVPNETLDTKINDLKTWTDDNYVQKGSSSDLSEYAKIADVNTAFNELATALGGL